MNMDLDARADAEAALKIAKALASKAAPIALSSPGISGTPAQGSTLTGVHADYTTSPTGYTYRWLLNGSVIAGATALTYVVQAGDVGGAISFEETPSNAIGAGSANLAAAVTILAAAPTAPAAPTISIASVTATAITLNWADGANNGAAITNRYIAIGTTSGGEGALQAVTVASGQVTISGLTTGTTYFIEGWTRNSVGYSPASNEVNAKPTAGYSDANLFYYSSSRPRTPVTTGAVPAGKEYMCSHVELGSVPYATNNHRIALPSHYTLNNGNTPSEFAAPNTIYVDGVSIGYGATPATATWSTFAFAGSQTATIDPTTNSVGIASDALNFAIPANTNRYVRVAYHTDAGATMISGLDLRTTDWQAGQATTLAAYLTNGQTLTNSGRIASLGYSIGWITSKGADGRPIFIAPPGTDSITYNKNENAANQPVSGGGWLPR